MWGIIHTTFRHKYVHKLFDNLAGEAIEHLKCRENVGPLGGRGSAGGAYSRPTSPYPLAVGDWELPPPVTPPPPQPFGCQAAALQVLL